MREIKRQFVITIISCIITFICWVGVRVILQARQIDISTVANYLAVLIIYVVIRKMTEKALARLGFNRP